MDRDLCHGREYRTTDNGKTGHRRSCTLWPEHVGSCSFGPWEECVDGFPFAILTWPEGEIGC